LRPLQQLREARWRVRHLPQGSGLQRDPQTSIVPLYECRACLSCVQGCHQGILAISLNPEFLAMGDDY